MGRQNIQLFVICALRVNKCEFSVYKVRIFMKFTPKQLINSSPNYFPSLADEIAERRPNMNNKFTAFTVS